MMKYINKGFLCLAIAGLGISATADEFFDFESDNVGYSYGGSAVVVAGGSASAQSLELPATSNSSGYVPLTPIDQADDSTTVQFDAQWSDSNNGDFGIGLSEVATISEWNQFGPYVAGTTAGDLLYRDGGSSLKLTTLPVDFSIHDWHTFKMVLSQTTETYDLFIDGVQYATGAAYRDQGTNEDLVTLGMKGNSDSTTGFARVDNITVIPEPATLGMVAAFGGGLLFIRRRLMI